MPKPDYTSLSFPPHPEGRPYVFINMVASIDGKVVVEDTERGIGSKSDQRLMRELRVHADIILNGAGTLRKSGASPRLGDPQLEELRIARGKPRLPTSSVLSRTGDLPLDRAFFTAEEEFAAIVYLSDAAPPEVRRRVIEAGRPVISVPQGHELEVTLAHMYYELGAEMVLCEGGPELNAQLFAAGMVDEMFLTVGPVIVGGRDILTAVTGHPATRETLHRMELVSAVPNEETDEVYLRYRARR